MGGRKVNRRSFLSWSAAGLAGTASIAGNDRRANPAPAAPQSSQRFTLNYAPHFGMFQHSGGEMLVDQLKFAADQGFTAWEDNGMKDRPVAVQEQIAGNMQQLGMQMGVVSATRGLNHLVSFAGGNQNARDQVLRSMEKIVDVARRVNAKHLTVVPGMAHRRLPEDYQTASCIELLKRCADIVEPHGLIMVLEPLNRITNHPGVFLHGAPQAYLLCKAVNRPSCKILFDIYHQQITEGNLIPNIDRCWDEIAYFQSGDNPGRNEPGTGEINYQKIFQHIYASGYRGVVGMEHGNSRSGGDGERAVIAAYHRVDPPPAEQS